MKISDQEKQEVFYQITDHLLKDEKPSDYINALSKDAEYAGYPFSMLWKLKETEQSKKYHPEGSVWNHTMLVLNEAARVREKSKDEKALMWAALLHDIGKPKTTKMRNGKTTSYDHDKAGEELCAEFLRFFIDDRTFIMKVSALVRYHMHMLYVLKGLPYGDVTNMLRKVDINEIALLCRCDRMGRLGVDMVVEEAEYKEFIIRLERMKVI
ncbi:MAG: HD domain-containing protein [Herbinix sp.]|nr:HD domain-containing protein [Herbinix sp.]